MILKDRGLPKEKVKNISMGFKKALVTGALFASVATAGIGLTGCGVREGENTRESTCENTYKEPHEDPYRPGHVNFNEKVNFSVVADHNGESHVRNFKYVVDELTDIVYLENYGTNGPGGITPALILDEETGVPRVMTKADLEKILDYDMDSVEK